MRERATKASRILKPALAGLFFVAVASGAGAAEPPPAPILMTTTATVPPVPPAIDAAATAAVAASATATASPGLPPPRQAALETAGMTPAQEARYRALTHELRCPLCQNQAIADSDAPISADLREQVRARILAGASDDDIRTFVTDRFGEFALYRPRFGGTTLWLWLAPLALLLAGGAMVLLRLRSGGASPRPAAAAGPTADASASLPPPGVAGVPAATGAFDPASAADPDAEHRLARLLAEEGVPAPATRPPSLPDSHPRLPA